MRLTLLTPTARSPGKDAYSTGTEDPLKFPRTTTAVPSVPGASVPSVLPLEAKVVGEDDLEEEEELVARIHVVIKILAP